MTFSGYRGSEFGGYRFYRFRPRRLKVFDERALGSGVFVTAWVRFWAERTKSA